MTKPKQNSSTVGFVLIRRAEGMRNEPSTESKGNVLLLLLLLNTENT